MIYSIRLLRGKILSNSISFIKFPHGKLLGVVYRPALTNNVDLDLSGVFHFALNFVCHFTGNDLHVIVRNLLGLDHNTDLTAGLNGVGLFNAAKALGNLLQLFQTFDVVFKVFSACARSCRRNGIGCLYQHRNDGFGFHVAMVRFNGVNDLLALLELLGALYADLNMGAFHVVGKRLANVVE